MAQQTTNAAADEMRTICSSLKQLESEAAYKLQVSATDGPASAILHFTTQTNGISGFFFFFFRACGMSIGNDLTRWPKTLCSWRLFLNKIVAVFLFVPA